MTIKKVELGLENGLEARAIAMFVQLAGQCMCSVNLEYKGRKVNAKSIMGMMSLGIARGEEVSVITDGNGEERAAQRLAEYLINGKEN